MSCDVGEVAERLQNEQSPFHFYFEFVLFGVFPQFISTCFSLFDVLDFEVVVFIDRKSLVLGRNSH